MPHHNHNHNHHHRYAHRVGKWMPHDQKVIEGFLSGLIDDVTSNPPEKLHPVIQDFKHTIETDPQIYMLFHQMFEEIPTKPPYDKDPTGTPQVRNYTMMLHLLNSILTLAPAFNPSGLVGFPINAILDWPMGTASGRAAFLNSKVNHHFHAILTAWARFLSSPESTSVLTASASSSDNDTSWFGPAAATAMPTFAHDFQCDPSHPSHGFTSWDAFFTRRFRPGVRPIAAPDDDRIIINACESAPYRVARDVKARDRFWIKAQPYSVLHMLADDALAPQFVGGTIYQAFLSAFSYHRWHSPVGGTVVKAYVVPGTYYSEVRAFGIAPPAAAAAEEREDGGGGDDGVDAEEVETTTRPDVAAPNDSQGYITEVATRALVFIEADNPDIGLMCFMAVGMAEVSTCNIGVTKGQRVTKGEELGMFHFGGSTHCLLFRPSVEVVFDLRGQEPGLEATNIKVNEYIGLARKKGG